jgi:hypothetical protein
MPNPFLDDTVAKPETTVEVGHVMTKEEAARFDRAASHAHLCPCEDCNFWWQQTGKDRP